MKTEVEKIEASFVASQLKMKVLYTLTHLKNIYETWKEFKHKSLPITEVTILDVEGEVIIELGKKLGLKPVPPSKVVPKYMLQVIEEYGCITIMSKEFKYEG